MLMLWQTMKKVYEDGKMLLRRLQRYLDNQTDISDGQKVFEMEPMTGEMEDFIPDDEPEALSGYEKILYDTVLIPSGTEEIERPELQNDQLTSMI